MRAAVHVDVARLLLDKGADVNRAAKGGYTPLYIACYHSHVDAARLLLEKNAEVDRAGAATPRCTSPARRTTST